MKIIKNYKLRNPLKPDEFVKQQVLVGNKPQYDYKNCDWVAIDTEFLSLDIHQDQLCVIQIASPDPELQGAQRVEVVWTFGATQEEIESTRDLISQFLTNDDLRLIVHLATADLVRLTKFTNSPVKARIFDTKVSSKIVLTNTNQHGLSSLIQNLVDPHFNKDKAQTSSQWDLSPLYWTDAMVEYAALDVYYLFGLMSQLQKIAERRGTIHLVQKANKILPEICDLVSSGYNVNVLTY